MMRGSVKRGSFDDDGFNVTDIALMVADHQSPPTAGKQGMMWRIAARAFADVRSFTKERRERRRLRRELTELGQSGSLDRVLADANLSAADVEPMLANYPASGHLLNDVAARLDIADAIASDPVTERDLLRVCTLCGSQGRCKRWLRSSATIGFEEFCPNADRLAEIRHFGHSRSIKMAPP